MTGKLPGLYSRPVWVHAHLAGDGAGGRPDSGHEDHTRVFVGGDLLRHGSHSDSVGGRRARHTHWQRQIHRYQQWIRSRRRVAQRRRCPPDDRALAPGSRNIVATYSGDSTFSASVSASLDLTVAPSPRTVATAFQNNARHDGMATGDTFTPATLHRAWSTDVNPAEGTSRLSYPLIAGGRAFVISSYATSGWTWVSELHVFDATTGSVDWTAPISSTYPHLGLTYDGGQVFVQNTEGDLTAYDAVTGQINWASTPQFQWSFDSPPTAYNGVWYATGGGFGGTLYAVSETNGALMWSSPVANGNHSSPTVDDSGVYVHFAGDVSYGFGLDRTCRWYTYFGTSGGGGATAVLNGGHLYLHAGVGGPGALILSTDTGASTGDAGAKPDQQVALGLRQPTAGPALPATRSRLASSTTAG